MNTVKNEPVKGSISRTSLSIYQSPVRTLIILSLLIFISEAIVMFVLGFMGEFSVEIEAVLDSTFLLILLAPTLYSFVFRPLVVQVNNLKAAEEEQVKLNRTIEAKVTQQEKQIWLSAGHTGLNEEIRGEQDIKALCKKTISYLASYIKAQVGVIYLADQNKMLNLMAGYAYKEFEGDNTKFEFGEGLAGQSAASGENIIAEHVPDNYIKISSGWGDAYPHNIIVIPFSYAGNVVGVMEFGSFEKFTAEQVEFLNSVVENIAIAVNMVFTTSQTAELLEETQAQAEELQVQQEELQTANEELEERAKILEQSKVVNA